MTNDLYDEREAAEQRHADGHTSEYDNRFQEIQPSADKHRQVMLLSWYEVECVRAPTGYHNRGSAIKQRGAGGKKERYRGNRCRPGRSSWRKRASLPLCRGARLFTCASPRRNIGRSRQPGSPGGTSQRLWPGAQVAGSADCQRNWVRLKRATPQIPGIAG